MSLLGSNLDERRNLIRAACDRLEVFEWTPALSGVEEHRPAIEDCKVHLRRNIYRWLLDEKSSLAMYYAFAETTAEIGINFFGERTAVETFAEMVLLVKERLAKKGPPRD
jgi:hypothetical protein